MTGDEVMSRMIVLRQARGLAGLVQAFSLVVACFAAGHADAQTKPQEPPKGEIYIAPDRHGYEMKLENRKHIVCSARWEVYERQQCEKACTDACRNIGTSLRECDALKTVACAR